jgi:NAD(P)-dependent dehydrogenase (short-subunit alcohol dehydrogenase family)
MAFDGQRVIVTGASSGLGAHIVRHLRTQGPPRWT